MLTRVLLVTKNPFFKGRFGKGVKVGRVEDNYYYNKILNSNAASCHCSLVIGTIMTVSAIFIVPKLFLIFFSHFPLLSAMYFCQFQYES